MIATGLWKTRTLGKQTELFLAPKIMNQFQVSAVMKDIGTRRSKTWSCHRHLSSVTNSFACHVLSWSSILSYLPDLMCPEHHSVCLKYTTHFPIKLRALKQECKTFKKGCWGSIIWSCFVKS
jgi:hypothetical protein